MIYFLENEPPINVRMKKIPISSIDDNYCKLGTSMYLFLSENCKELRHSLSLHDTYAKAVQNEFISCPVFPKWEVFLYLTYI